MAVKNLRQRIVAFVAGLLLGPTVVWAGLESATYISDLVASNPLSSDLASTADDHIRLLKSTIKTTFPNINNAVTVTDEQLNAVGASGVTGAANPTGTVGLTAVNGSATTFMRSDGAPALSQAITPTWSGVHKFTRFSTAGTGLAAGMENATNPGIYWKETGAAVDNKTWEILIGVEQFRLRTVNDADNSVGNIMLVDRTGTTVDIVSFPTDNAAGNFRVGPALSATINNPRMTVRSASSGVAAAQFTNGGGTGPVVAIHNVDTSNDNGFLSFLTEAAGTLRGSITYNRAGGAVAYNTTSDERLKKNIKPAGSARQLINSIPIDEYHWNESGAHVRHGFVAQRLNKVAPECVSSSNDPKVIWAVEKSCLVPALIKYVQEQDARIARLEADAARRN